jgi:hypothetical protein
MKIGRKASVLILLAILSFSGTILLPATAGATPDYAKQTGFECGKCHVDAIGGGKLTPAGEQFLSELQAKGQYRQLTTMQHTVRLVVGYFHAAAITGSGSSTSTFS